jgi:uncharacterized protein YcbK (DUF882 family)
MGGIMYYFKDEEFLCKCGRIDCPAPRKIHPDLALKLDVMRRIYGGPMVVTSGIRCTVANARVGGVPDSEHLTAEAADIACPVSAVRFDMINAALKAGFRRYGVGATFIHVDVSKEKVQDVTWLYPSSR